MSKLIYKKYPFTFQMNGIHTKKAQMYKMDLEGEIINVAIVRIDKYYKVFIYECGMCLLPSTSKARTVKDAFHEAAEYALLKKKQHNVLINSLQAQYEIRNSLPFPI